jgi:hypothetical protein
VSGARKVGKTLDGRPDARQVLRSFGFSAVETPEIYISLRIIRLCTLLIVNMNDDLLFITRAAALIERKAT